MSTWATHISIPQSISFQLYSVKTMPGKWALYADSRFGSFIYWNSAYKFSRNFAHETRHFEIFHKLLNVITILNSQSELLPPLLIWWHQVSPTLTKPIAPDMSSCRICYAFPKFSRFDEDNTVTYTSPRPQFQKFCVVNIKLPIALVYFTNRYPSPNFFGETVDVWKWNRNCIRQIISCSIAIAKSSISFVGDAENKWNETQNTLLQLSPKFHMTHIQISTSTSDWYFKC